jgi:hypothetical protein
MPNWCSNTLQISGDKEQLELFKQKSIIKSGMDVDIFLMNGCIPMPQELAICEDMTPEQKAERIAKYGYDNWYDWRFENWGTRTDAHDSEIQEDENGLTISFETAWSPAIPYIKQVAIMFPDLIFDLYFMETGEWFAGRVFAKGEEVNEQYGEPMQVDDDGNQVRYDEEKDMYRILGTEEYTEDTHEINPFV